jgi:hypothetical protein
MQFVRNTLLHSVQKLALAGVVSLICGSQLCAQRIDRRSAVVRETRVNYPLPNLIDTTSTGTFITFDVPGGMGTVATAITDGSITGYYLDVNSVVHGFLRTDDSTLRTFDFPGAVNGTAPLGINDSGDITGAYSDNTGSTIHGFVNWAEDGSFDSFDAPDGVHGTEAKSVNGDGFITGAYFDSNNVAHGFLRSPEGDLQQFNAPGGVNGTFPYFVTDDVVVLGIYLDASNIAHGFMRSRRGKFTEINGPDGATGQFAEFNAGPPLSMNSDGVIVGTYFSAMTSNPMGGDSRVFVRSQDGKYTTFDAANYPPCCIWSAPAGINDRGTITGSFLDGFNITHGFLRSSNGHIITLDAPGAGQGGLGQGTFPIGLTSRGVVGGFYTDSQNVSHGFLFRSTHHHH